MKKILSIALVLLACIPTSALATAAPNVDKAILVYGVKARERQMTDRLSALLSELPPLPGEQNPSVQTEPEPEPVEYTPLEKYDEGPAVKALQTRLKALGFLTGKVDGDYGGGTTSAVRRFQEAASLKVTGAADIPTQKALFADDAPSAPNE